MELSPSDFGKFRRGWLLRRRRRLQRETATSMVRPCLFCQQLILPPSPAVEEEIEKCLSRFRNEYRNQCSGMKIDPIPKLEKVAEAKDLGWVPD